MKSLRRSLNNNSHGHGHSHSNSQSGSGSSVPFNAQHHPNAGPYPGGGAMAPGMPGGAPGVPSGAAPPPLFTNPMSRPTERVAPPQKVIKALTSYRSTNPQELSYTKGDFFYVTGERDGWYEALNPITGSRGVVSKKGFEEFAKGGRQQQQQGAPGHNDLPPPAAVSAPEHSRSHSHTPNNSNPMHSPTAHMGPTSAPSTPGMKRGTQPLYAIVQYDFHAERPDELEAKAGEPIVVIAQSNHEWFVAKPIGRLGGPGLIPVSFVEIRDPTTGRPLESFPTNIPQVEEWKKATAEYKAAAIPLGRLDLPPDQRVTNSPYAAAAEAAAQAQGVGGGSAQTPSRASQRTLDSKHSRSRSHASSSRSAARDQPGQLSRSSSHRTGYRPEHDAMLPPGELLQLGVPSFHNESSNYWFRLHVAFVPDDRNEPAYTLILYRTYEDFYEFQISLLDTFPTEAGRPENEGEQPPPRILPYMPGPVDEEIDDELTEYRRDELDAYVRALLDLRGAGAGYILRHDLIRTFFAAKFGDYCEETPREQLVEELQRRLGEVLLDSNGPAQAQQHQANSRAPAVQAASANHHNWNNGYAAAPGGHQRSASRDMPSSQGGHARNLSNNAPPLSATPHAAGWGGGNGKPIPAPSGLAPAAAAAPAPAPRAGAAFVKIKVYDRATDDLIALRVHPQVTYADLMDKVRARLGPNVSTLQHRVGANHVASAAAGAQGPCREIRNDRDLAEWMATEDTRLVLYAEQ